MLGKVYSVVEVLYILTYLCLPSMKYEISQYILAYNLGHFDMNQILGNRQGLFLMLALWLCTHENFSHFLKVWARAFSMNFVCNRCCIKSIRKKKVSYESALALPDIKMNHQSSIKKYCHFNFSCCLSYETEQG